MGLTLADNETAKGVIERVKRMHTFSDWVIKPSSGQMMLIHHRGEEMFKSEVMDVERFIILYGYHSF